MASLVIGVLDEELGTLVNRDGKADADTKNPKVRDQLLSLFDHYALDMLGEKGEEPGAVNVDDVFARMDERMNGRTWARLVLDSDAGEEWELEDEDGEATEVEEAEEAT